MNPSKPHVVAFNKNVISTVVIAVVALGGIVLINTMGPKNNQNETEMVTSSDGIAGKGAIPEGVAEMADSYAQSNDPAAKGPELSGTDTAGLTGYPETPQVSTNQNPFLTVGNTPVSASYLNDGPSLPYRNSYQGNGGLTVPSVSLPEGSGGYAQSEREQEKQAARGSQIRFNLSGGSSGNGLETNNTRQAEAVSSGGITTSNQQQVSSQSGSFYSQSRLEAPRSKFEVKAGTIIPAVLITGIQSQLAGQITAQVRECVYDSVSGNHLLIPQGSKLIGLYNNQVSYGQDRVMVVWTRLIFPNGVSLDLENMQGVDLSGYSGLKDKINNHWGQLITGAVVTSLLSAGAAVASDDSSDNSYKEAVGSALAQNISQTGNQVVQRSLTVSPTITIRPGTKFNLFVSKDFILQPYH